ncbi:hypothetical protein RM844_32780, partial [Streptomyces sp. DSM 44915]
LTFSVMVRRNVVPQPSVPVVIVIRRSGVAFVGSDVREGLTENLVNCVPGHFVRFRHRQFPL